MKKTNLIFTIMILMFAVGLQAGIKLKYLSSGNEIDGAATTSTLNLDIDGDGINELALSVPTANNIKFTSSSKGVRFFVQKVGTGTTEGEDNILALADGTSFTTSYSTGGAINTTDSYINSAGHNGGTAFTAGDMFIGFTFELSGADVHAGWMQVSLADNKLTIKRIAYEETKATAIPITFVPVAKVTVSAAGSATTLAKGSTLQMSASVAGSTTATPTSNKVVWTTTGGTGLSIDVSSGILKAESDATGVVVVEAKATDGSEVKGMMSIAIPVALTGVVISGTGVTGTGADKVATITTDGGSITLEVTNTPAGATTITDTVWESKMVSVATVDDMGKVTAVGNGKVKILVTVTQTASPNVTKSDSVEITVSSQIIKVTKIVVDGPSSDTIIEKMKDSLLMKAVVTPTDAANDTVMWSLKGGPKTYKYDVDADGDVDYEFKDTQAGVAFGKDTTFTVKVGDKLYFKMEDKIGTDHPFLIKSKVSAGDADTLKVSDGVTGNGKAMVTFMPKSVDTFYYVCKNHIAMTGKIIVSAADPVIATIDQKGMLKANGKGDGTVTVMATAKDGSKTVGTKRVIIKNQTSTVFDIDGVDNITVYPNPTTEVLNIKGKTEERYESVTIYSLDGKVVLNETVTGTTHSMNINRLNTGAYLLKVVSENGNIYTKNIIKK